MKLFDNILYIEFADFLTAGYKEDTIKKANHRNGPFWQMIPDPLDRRKVLVQFDTLRPKDQEKITAQFGNPYEFMAKEPIKKLLASDVEAELYFKDYRYQDTKELPQEHQTKYIKAAEWLNMLARLNENKKFIKKELNLSLEVFWNHVCEIIAADKVDLPTSYRRLRKKLDDYKENGYSSLIDWRFGNKLSAKVGKTEDGFCEDRYNKQVAFIRKANSMHQNFDAQQITSFCNPIFEKNGWPTVSRATVYNIMRENEHLTLAGRRGKREYHNSISMQHKRRRPDYPLFYFTLDGWTVELLYREGNSFNNRMVVVIVLDAHNNYPVGYAIGDRENTELIRMANRNASQHIYELFGQHYQPRQLQSDNYGIKNLTPFYQAMAHLHTPAAVGNAKSKVIEPYFKDLNKNYCMRFPNWSGFNINSKKSNQPNVEFLDKIKHSFPDRAGVIAQIEMIIAQERKIKVDQYLQNFEACPAADKILMSQQDRLMVFGKPHNYSNSITGAGLQITLGGERLVFDSFDPAFRQLQHSKWQVVYDEFDLSSVLAINEDGKGKFVLEQKRTLPMDVHSMNGEDHNYRERINNFNKQRMAEVVQTYIDDNTAVAEIMATTPLALDDYNEASIKMMFTHNGQQKERLQDAKGLRIVQDKERKAEAKELKTEAKNWQQAQEEYLNSKTDFNQYLD